ncbi:DNA polymerase epsilon subunit 3 isoform X2 [Triticum aestivum]|uniref:DNA polymerase epsilon subunit 3 isoform X2 n=1 Tax=Triticum aestivum TaxID=4565 RepID=UPI0008438E49|nr:DNA polymerase epsilon subunit 3-like isoform X2 [Triticum aestivum]
MAGEAKEPEAAAQGEGSKAKAKAKKPKAAAAPGDEGEGAKAKKPKAAAAAADEGEGAKAKSKKPKAAAAAANEGSKGKDKAAAAPVAAMTEAEVEELPKAIVRRLVKDKLARAASGGEGAEGGAEVIVNKDAMAAFAESARIFIHYLSATANDVCKDGKRQTINAEDVFKALDEIEFPEFVEPLRTALEEFRSRNAARKPASGKKQSEKKRKLDKEAVPEEQNGAADEANADED